MQEVIKLQQAIYDSFKSRYLAPPSPAATLLQLSAKRTGASRVAPWRFTGRVGLVGAVGPRQKETAVLATILRRDDVLRLDLCRLQTRPAQSLFPASAAAETRRG